MKMPSYRRILKTDFKAEFQAFVDQLSVSINYGFDSVYNALNRGLTVRDNFSATVKDVTVIVDSNGVPTSTTLMTLDITSKVDGLLVTQALNLTNPTIYPNAVFVSFTQQAQTIVINKVTGLVAGSKYQIRLVALGT